MTSTPAGAQTVFGADLANKTAFPAPRNMVRRRVVDEGGGDG